MKKKDFKKMQIKEAQKVLQEEQEKKINACNEELLQVLTKHGMKIDVQSLVRVIPIQ